MTPADVLEEAAERLRRPAMWITGDYGDVTDVESPHCAVGWVRAVAYQHHAEDAETRKELWLAAARAMHMTLHIHPYEDSIEMWNDTKASNSDAVADAMIDAAKLLRNEGEKL